MSQPLIDLQRQAQAIPLQSKTYRGSIGGSNAKDYYRVRLDRSSHLSLNLRGITANADLALLNGKGQLVQQSRQRGRRSDSLRLDLAADTYFIQVSRQGSKTRYQLRLATAEAASTQPSPAPPLIDRVLALTNLQRQQSGLQPLRLSTQLNAAAQRHSADMAVNDYFSHTGADGSSPFDRIKAAGYTYSAAAENIAAGYASPDALVTAWMNSPGHRANILNPMLQEIGIGYRYLEDDRGNSNYHYYWTQSFGTPFR